MSSVSTASAPATHLAAEKTPDPFLQLEAFDIPSSRLVHGNAFPLGLRPSSATESPSLEDVVVHIKELADQGTLQSLLTKRKLGLDFDIADCLTI